MDLISYLNIVRRRWLLVVSTVALSLLVVWLTLPDNTQKATSAPVSYTATATLIVSPTTDTPLNLATVALFSTLGEVPQRVTKKLGYNGEPQVLAASVSAVVAEETGTLAITSTNGDGEVASRRVNTFATELISYFERIERRRAQNQLDDVNKAVTTYAAKIEALDHRIAVDPDNSALIAERGGLESFYQGLVGQAALLQGQALTASSPLELLQRGIPVPQSGSTTFAPPSSARDRLLVGGGLGLLLGLALALVVERLDSRLRTREQAESAFKLPVLAEIPALPWQKRRDRTILSAANPGSATAESYRSLRSAVLLLRPGPAGKGLTPDADGHTPAVILVTSARPSEGKSATVANLAVVMAESGRRVLVLSLDFRNPKIHDYLEAPSGSGLSELLSADRPRELDRVVRDTRFPGVRIATSGQEMSHPGALLTGAGPLIDRAREIADIILIDTAPLLSVSDAVDLSPHVDAALVVTRANRTTVSQAMSAQRLLSRLGVPALGAVLIGGTHGDPFEGYPLGPRLSRQFSDKLGFPARAHEGHERDVDASTFRATPSRGNDA